MDRPPTVHGECSSPATAPGTANAPHFFKIILSSIIDDRRLRIPPAFTRKFLDEISDVAVVTAPNGKTWNVQVKKEKDEIWFKKGLHEFFKNYSVCVGHLLVFKYEGNSHFCVLIFDKSATEIMYPSGPEQITQKNKVVDVVANKGRRYPYLAAESLEPERKARRSKVIDEFSKKGRGKESSKHRDKAGKLDCGSKRSGENQKGSRDFGSSSLKELHGDKKSVTEDNEQDESVEILDVFPCHEKVPQKNVIDEGGEGRNKLQNQCHNNRHSLRLVASRSKGIVDFSSRLCELRDDCVVYGNGVKFKLSQIKKEPVKEIEQASELVDKSKRCLSESKGNEQVVFVFDNPSEKNILEEQNCGKKSNSEENQAIDINPTAKMQQVGTDYSEEGFLSGKVSNY